MAFSFPENIKTVVGKAPTTTNTAVTSDIVSLKGASKCWVELIFKQAVSHQTVITLYESDDVAGTTTSAISTTMPNWTNSDISTSDTLTHNSDSATVTLAAGATDQHVIMQVDPSILTDGYPCIYAYTSASSQPTDFVTILFHIETGYPGDQPPSAIID